MLLLQESAEIHEYSSGTSVPVPSTTCTQSMTLHNLIWHEKCDTNQMPFLTQFTSSLPFPVHKAQRHIWQENHQEVPINQGSLNVFFSHCMRHGWAYSPTAFSINDNISFQCQVACKPHPMKQSMHSSSFQFLQSTQTYYWTWSISYNSACHLHQDLWSTWWFFVTNMVSFLIVDGHWWHTRWSQICMARQIFHLLKNTIFTVRAIIGIAISDI